MPFELSEKKNVEITSIRSNDKTQTFFFSNATIYWKDSISNVACIIHPSTLTYITDLNNNPFTRHL